MENAQGVVDDYYYSVIDIYPDNMRPYLLATKVFFFYGQHDDSLGVIERAKDANLTSNEMELYYGKNLRLSSQSKEEDEVALEFLLDLYENMKRTQDNDEEFNNLGEVLQEVARAYADLGEFDKGLKTINQAIKFGDYYATKGYLLMDLEMYDPAIKIFKELIEKYPHNEYYYNDLARCYENTDKEDALEVYKKILDINPENIEVIKKIIDIYENLAHKEQDIEYHKLAISYAERIFEIDPESHCVSIARIYTLGYQFEKALEYCKKAAEYDTDNPWENAYYNIMIAHCYHGSMKKAIKYSLKLLSLDMSSSQFKNVAELYFSIGNLKKAKYLNYWTKALLQKNCHLFFFVP